MTRILSLAILLAALSPMLVACNTAAGVGEDVSDFLAESRGLRVIAIPPALTTPMKATTNSARFERKIATRSPIAMPRDMSPLARRVDCSSMSPKVRRTSPHATASR